MKTEHLYTLQSIYDLCSYYGRTIEIIAGVVLCSDGIELKIRLLDHGTYGADTGATEFKVMFMGEGVEKIVKDYLS